MLTLSSISGGGSGTGTTNLSYTAATRTVASDTGTDAVITEATTSDPGLLSAIDKDKLDNVEANAKDDQTGLEIVTAIDTQLGSSSWQTGGSGSTDLTWVAASSTMQSSSGNDAVITLVDATNPGFMSAADYTRLLNVEANAKDDQTGAEIVTAIDTQLGSSTWQTGGGTGTTNLSYTAATRTVASDTGTDAVIPEATGSDPGLMSSGDFTKLSNIETDAKDDQTGAEIQTLLDTELGSTIWRTDQSLTGAEIVALIDAELGNTLWRSVATQAADTFDPVDFSPTNVTLSNGDTTATLANTSGFGRAAGNDEIAAGSGGYYIEFDIDSTMISAQMYGVCNELSGFANQYPGQDINSIGCWRGGGATLYNNGSTGTAIRDTDGSALGVVTTGARECMYFDSDTGNLWYGQINGGNVEWFRDPSSNVADPINGANPHQTLGTGSVFRFLLGDGNSSNSSQYTIVPAASRVGP